MCRMRNNVVPKICKCSFHKFKARNFRFTFSHELGKEYEVLSASTDESLHCAEGINLATLDWCMREWQEGYRILIAEFTAKDIACIPIATYGKFRVFRCKIVGEKDLKEIGLIESEKAE